MVPCNVLEVVVRQAKAHGSLILTADTALFNLSFLSERPAQTSRAFSFASFKGITHEISQPFGINQIRRDRPLTHEELMSHVPSVFGRTSMNHAQNVTPIPTITLLENLQREGFQPFFACQTRVRDLNKREHTKHMLRLRRAGQITGQQVPEIILLNSMMAHQLPDVTGSVPWRLYQRLVCGQSFGEVRVPHKGNVVGK
jgi:hypothetical protein